MESVTLRNVWHRLLLAVYQTLDIAVFITCYFTSNYIKL